MTRVTPLPRELAKLTSSLAAPRASQLFVNSGARAAAAKLHVRKELEHLPNAVSERTMTTTHRPTPTPLPSPHRTNIPLMQSFHNTATPRARADTSTIDFAFLPALSEPLPSSSPALRYPLLPDNFAASAASAPAALFAPEAVDAPLAAPQILVLDPEADVVSALSEVEGMGPDGVELRFGEMARGGGEEGEEGGEYAGGMLTDLWKGLVDDVLGAGAKGGKVAV